MRTTSYITAFFAVSIILALNILSTTRSDWLVVKTPERFRTRITIKYGLRIRCEHQVIRLPGPSDGGKFEYTDDSCRPFPQQTEEGCDGENKAFCLQWTVARLASEGGIVLAGLSLLAVMWGVTTRSRRRTTWPTVAALIFINALSQIVTFAIVTDLYRTAQYPPFEYAKFGLAYLLNGLSWLYGLFVALGVLATGISADRGIPWAAGDRAYLPIHD